MPTIITAAGRSIDVTGVRSPREEELSGCQNYALEVDLYRVFHELQRQGSTTGFADMREDLYRQHGIDRDAYIAERGCTCGCPRWI